MTRALKEIQLLAAENGRLQRQAELFQADLSAAKLSLQASTIIK
jgi:hypothetical protein